MTDNFKKIRQILANTHAAKGLKDYIGAMNNGVHRVK